jgi:hypothetical protein
VHNESWEEHLQHLDVVFFKLREVNLKLNPNKCCFAAKSITFLGHVVSKEGTRLDPGKIEVVLHFSRTKDGHKRQVVFRSDRVLPELCPRLFTISNSTV